MIYQERAGAIGALLAEYEKAIVTLQHVIEDITDRDLVKIADPVTESPDNRLIQTVLAHVVRSGYSYAIYIRNSKNRPDLRPPKVNRTTAAEYIEDLNQVLAFTAATFQDIQDDELEQFDDHRKIHILWGTGIRL